MRLRVRARARARVRVRVRATVTWAPPRSRGAVIGLTPNPYP